MALLGLPVPRHATGVFIDDVVGSIASPTDPSPLLGGNCTASHLAAEIGAGIRLDRTCVDSYASGEDPAVSGATSGWDESRFRLWRHAIHYRDLYQQKLAFVRGYLTAQGTLPELEGKGYGFLKTTLNADQYYDEGADGRCAAYDPFNKFGNPSIVGQTHRYTIQPLEFGKCGSCSSAEKVFLTGEELTIRGRVVCTQNNWDLVKQYYVQGIKGLMVVYNRQVAQTKAANLLRNLLLTLALAGVAFSSLLYLVTAFTLADPMELVRRHRGEECALPDVRSALPGICPSLLCAPSPS